MDGLPSIGTNTFANKAVALKHQVSWFTEFPILHILFLKERAKFNLVCF